MMVYFKIDPFCGGINPKTVAINSDRISDIESHPSRPGCIITMAFQDQLYARNFTVVETLEEAVEKINKSIIGESA
jgi:hypothetical protein